MPVCTNQLLPMTSRQREGGGGDGEVDYITGSFMKRNEFLEIKLREN